MPRMKSTKNKNDNILFAMFDTPSVDILYPIYRHDIIDIDPPTDSTTCKIVPGSVIVLISARVTNLWRLQQLRHNFQRWYQSLLQTRGTSEAPNRAGLAGAALLVKDLTIVPLQLKPLPGGVKHQILTSGF
jgi:hypothetical protein